MEEFDHLRISLEKIISATDDFAPNKQIGHGGFGSVYKGELSPSEGEGLITVACKRLNRINGQGDVEFKKEINMLSQYQHENLSSLLHFCIEGDERILVYKYVSRGSLDHYLSEVTLTWTQRLNICIGVARALNYLHDPRDTHQRIIHRDVKSSNILLDEEWNAKVSDFGLSKFGPANQPQTYVFTSVAGTPGYCDPLYWENGILSKESDVYSFGVVLFEVMCGALCYEYSYGNLVPLWKESFEENRLDDIINHGLRTQMEPGSLNTFSTTAYQCLKRDREARPAMGEIVKKLEMALEQQEVIDSIGKRTNYDEMQRISDLVVPPLLYVSQSHLLLLFMKGMLVDNGKTWFSVNERGQHYELISASSVFAHETIFLIPSTNFVSRFSYLLKYVSTRNMRLKVMTQCLSPDVTYVINLVYKCDHPHQYDLLGIPFKYKLGEMGEYLISSAGEDKCVVNFKYNMEKMRQYTTSCGALVGEDGWLRTKLFQFTSTENQHYFDIDFSSEIKFGEHDQPLTIFIESVEFCPLEEDEIKLVDEVDIDWVERLPDDYNNIVKDIDKSMTKKEVYFLLRKGIHINHSINSSLPDSQQWFSISKKSKKRLMFPAREIMLRENSVWNFLSRRKSWKRKSLPGSRFKEVVEIGDTNHLSFFVNFHPWLLSTGIMYACYLVFKLPENVSVFEDIVVARFSGAYLASTTFIKESSIADMGVDTIYLVAPPHAPIIEVSRPGDDERVVKTRKIKGHPKLRKDGWMEVQLCEFLHDSHHHVLMGNYILSFGGYLKFTGLLVEGIEFRPAKVS